MFVVVATARTPDLEQSFRQREMEFIVFDDNGGDDPLRGIIGVAFVPLASLAQVRGGVCQEDHRCVLPLWLLQFFSWRRLVGSSAIVLQPPLPPLPWLENVHIKHVDCVHTVVPTAYLTDCPPHFPA